MIGGILFSKDQYSILRFSKVHLVNFVKSSFLYFLSLSFDNIIIANVSSSAVLCRFSPPIKEMINNVKKVNIRGFNSPVVLDGGVRWGVAE